MKILIIGDSFAADWSIKHTDYKGWPNLLSEKYEVTNLAQAGVSEYKIYKQLFKVNLDQFNIVIVSHTSPYRVHTRIHPVHSEDLLHKEADLMLADIEYHSKNPLKWFNKSLKAARDYFYYHFDIEYYETTYKLYQHAIHDLLKGKRVIIINNFPDNILLKNTLDFSQLRITHSGTVNHFSEVGNKIIFQEIVKKIKKYK